MSMFSFLAQLVILALTLSVTARPCTLDLHARSDNHRRLALLPIPVTPSVSYPDPPILRRTFVRYACSSPTSFWDNIPSDPIETECPTGTVCLYCGAQAISPCVWEWETCEGLGIPGGEAEPDECGGGSDVADGNSDGDDVMPALDQGQGVDVIDTGCPTSGVSNVTDPVSGSGFGPGQGVDGPHGGGDIGGMVSGETAALRSSGVTVAAPTQARSSTMKEAGATTSLGAERSTSSASTTISLIANTDSVNPTTYIIATSTQSTNSAGTLIYPPTTCTPITYSASITSPPSATLLLPTWTSSSYTPLTIPSPLHSDGTPSPSSVSLPGGLSCQIILPMAKNGGQARICVTVDEGGQMASVYTPVVGANCVGVGYDPMNSLVAAYPFPINNAGPTPFCGQTLEISSKHTGNSVNVTIVDSCSSCWGVQDVVTTSGSMTVNGASIDLGPAAYRALFGLDADCVPGVWDVEFTALEGAYAPQAVQNLVSPM